MAREALKNKAYTYILERIINNEIPYYSPIVEKEYSEVLNVSRTPVREALKQLDAEGLVYRIPDRGAFVKEITLADIEEIWELRKMFELHALKYSINKITDHEMNECRALLNQLNEHSNTQDFFRADNSFHRLVTKYCPNTRLKAYLKNLEAQIERLQRISASRENNYIRVKEQHLALLDVLETRDYEIVADALSRHLDEIHDGIIEVYNLQRLEIQ